MFRDKSHPDVNALVRRYMADRGLEALKAADEGVVRHVDGCAMCSGRYASLCRDLDGAGQAALDAADEAFSAERLLRQRERILRRLDTAGSRILSFPAAETGMRRGGAARARWGWVAAAAAAGLLIGVVFGQMLHVQDESVQVARAVRQTPRIGAAAPGVEPAALAISGEDFLSEVDLALSSPRTPELDAIDAMTLRIQGPPPPLKD